MEQVLVVNVYLPPLGAWFIYCDYLCLGIRVVLPVSREWAYEGLRQSTFRRRSGEKS